MDWVLLGIPAGIIMLYFGSDWLVRGAKDLALHYRISPFIIGLTILAFGSSAPEAITSIVSTETPDIIIGNVVGSNIANVGLALGLAAVISPIVCRYAPIRIEMCAMMVSVILMLVLGIGGFAQVESILLVLCLLLFLYIVWRVKSKDSKAQENYASDVKTEGKMLSKPVCLAAILAGLVLLYFGARFFVDGSVELAHMLGVSELLIGLIIVAIGTSLPELCISVMASFKGENDMAVANIVGSTIFNCFFVLGIGGALVNIPVSDATLFFHIPVMILITAVLFLMIRFNNGLGRKSGAVLLLFYIAYLALLVMFPELSM